MAVKIGGVVLAECVDLGELRERVQFPVEGPEPSDCFGMVGQPGVPFSASEIEVDPVRPDDGASLGVDAALGEVVRVPRR